MARIAFVGDVMLGRLVSEHLRRGKRPESCWGDVGPLLRATDGVIANLECAITAHDAPWLRTPKVFHFRADPKAVEVLAAGNVRAVCLANNHVLDFDVTGLRDTLAHLERAGIAHAGAGESTEEAFAPAHLRLGEVDLAMFAVTDNEPAFAAGPGLPGTAFLEPEVPEMRPTAAEIEAARRAGAQLVVLSCHMGPNMVREPSPVVRRYRRAMAKAGIDVIHGHSAHLTQGIERLGRTLVLHDTGDFLDDYATDPVWRNDWSFVFTLEIGRAGPTRLTLTPVVLDLAEVHLAGDADADAICAYMIEQSARLGTALVRSAEGLALVLEG